MIHNFIGRQHELEAFKKLGEEPGAKILVVYGRRRVGKTTLIEHAYEKRALWKFEGLENKSPSLQRKHFLDELAHKVGDPSLLKIKTTSWKEVFIELAKHCTKKKKITLYFEEIQWMASYKEELVTDLKYVWDNYFSKNPSLLLILCGSAPSFLIDKVMKSKALYNRAQHEFPIKEFTLSEAWEFFGKRKSKEETLDAYLAVGGIPEYFNYLTHESSVYLSLCKQSFLRGGFFVHEAERIFVSSLSKNLSYKKIIQLLALQGPLTRKEIITKLKLKSGGSTSSLFSDLEKCRFINLSGPFSFGTSARDAKVFLTDNYLQFYYKFILPQLSSITTDAFRKNPTKALPTGAYRQSLGYSFERFCLINAHEIAALLGFEAVNYHYGPIYVRGETTSSQIDLAFLRADKVLTVCEIKYQTRPPGKEIIGEFEKKLDQLISSTTKSIHRVLISPNGADSSLNGQGYFDRIITLDDLLC